MGIAKEIVPHGLVGHTKHHDGVIAEGVGVTADHMRLWPGMGRLHGNQ